MNISIAAFVFVGEAGKGTRGSKGGRKGNHALVVSSGVLMLLTMFSASVSALLYALLITTGWMSRSSWDSDCARISPAVGKGSGQLGIHKS